VRFCPSAYVQISNIGTISNDAIFLMLVDFKFRKLIFNENRSFPEGRTV
jgi:hypothetical protein